MNPNNLSSVARSPLQRTFAVGSAAKAWEVANPGKNVIRFMWGDTPFDAPNSVKEAMRDAFILRQTSASNLHKYPPVAGEMPALECVINDLARFGVGPLNLDQVMITNGCMEALEIATIALVGPGKTAILPGPFYHPLPGMIELAYGQVQSVMGVPENGFKITPEQLQYALSHSTQPSMIHLTNPTNPVGECYSADELKALAKVIWPYKDTAVVSDEIYESLIFDGTHTSFWAAAPELRDRMVILSSFSKNAGLSGLRIGWAGGSEDIIRGMKNIKVKKNWGTSTLGQEALYAALSDQDKFQIEVGLVRERLRGGSDLLSQRLLGMGFHLVPAKAGMFLFPKVPDGLNLPYIDDDHSMSIGERFARALIPFGLTVAPGIDMGLEDRVRIAFSLYPDDLNEGMDRMERALIALRQ